MKRVLLTGIAHGVCSFDLPATFKEFVTLAGVFHVSQVYAGLVANLARLLARFHRCLIERGKEFFTAPLGAGDSNARIAYPARHEGLKFKWRTHMKKQIDDYQPA